MDVPGTVVLVGDLGERTMLGGARQLAAAGWVVVAVGPSGRSLVGRSRAVSSVHDAPAPDRDVVAFRAAVTAVLAAHPRAVVLPCGDAELLAVGAAGAALGASTYVPSEPTVRGLLDKVDLAGRARAVGLGSPRLAGANPSGWPVFVKSRLHYVPGRDGSRWEARRADTGAQLRAALAAAAAAGVDVIVQAQAVGTRTSLVLVLDDTGAVVVRSQHEVQGCWPPNAGAATLARTTRVDDELADRSARLLRSVGWVGLAELEFLVGPGGAVLLDVNPRLYGSVALAAAAGAPVAVLAAEVLRGEHPSPRPDGRPGVGYTYLAGALWSAASARHPWRQAARTVLGTAARPHVGPVWSRRDPVPGLWQAAALARDTVVRRRPVRRPPARR